MCVCVCVCIYEIAHKRAIRPCHPTRYMPLSLVLPRGGSMILTSKTSDQTRQRGHTLSTCKVLTQALSTVLYLMLPSLLPCYCNSIFSLLSLSGSAATTKPTLYCLRFFGFPPKSWRQGACVFPWSAFFLLLPPPPPPPPPPTGFLGLSPRRPQPFWRYRTDTPTTPTRHPR